MFAPAAFLARELRVNAQACTATPAVAAGTLHLTRGNGCVVDAVAGAMLKCVGCDHRIEPCAVHRVQVCRCHDHRLGLGTANRFVVLRKQPVQLVRQQNACGERASGSSHRSRRDGYDSCSVPVNSMGETAVCQCKQRTLQLVLQARRRAHECLHRPQGRCRPAAHRQYKVCIMGWERCHRLRATARGLVALGRAWQACTGLLAAAAAHRARQVVRR